MSEEPKAPEGQARSDVASQEALDARLELNRRSLKREWEEAIRALKSALESERLDQERAESSKRLDRSIEWSKRYLCVIAGAVVMMFVMIFAEQCSSLHSRVSTLESKQSK
jgi:multidrug efflux pump subunit AcrA (membrane-fusion protein)